MPRPPFCHAGLFTYPVADKLDPLIAYLAARPRLNSAGQSDFLRSGIITGQPYQYIGRRTEVLYDGIVPTLRQPAHREYSPDQQDCHS